MRILHNKDLHFPVAQLYRNFNTLPPSKLHRQQIFILLQKSLYNSSQLPLVFGDYFVLNRSIHTYNTRNRSSFHLDSVNTTFGERSLKFKGAMLWNSLPASLREPMSRAKFKKLIKSYLIADSENWLCNNILFYFLCVLNYLIISAFRLCSSYTVQMQILSYL